MKCAIREMFQVVEKNGVAGKCQYFYMLCVSNMLG